MPDDDIIDDPVIIDEARALPAVRSSEAIVARDEISVEELLGQRDKIVQAMERAMRPGIHYGLIPGVQKPSLFKPGAELLNVLFRLAPSYHSERMWHDDGHLTVVSRCVLTHIPTTLTIGEGEGLCSTRESRYAYRQGGRTCPECGQTAIIKGKAEYGGGWLCFARKGGCGAKWADDTDQAGEFESAEIGRVENPDIADSYNTVLKMADKRALIAAILNCTAASDVFTQDVEDMSQQQGAIESNAPSERAERPFDPGKDLLPGALSGNDAPVRLAQALDGFDPSVDWQATLGQLVQARYDRPSWRELTGDSAKDFWRRLSNSVQWLTNNTPAGDFPPVEGAKLVEGFRFGFGDIDHFEIVYEEPAEAPLSAEEARRAEEAMATEDIPFGEDDAVV